MSHLFLQSFNANSGLSISLRHGQSCTIGTSAVADYRVNAIGVSAVHCRVVCRPNGGFVECLEDKHFIVINGKYCGRSRICHGDLLKIGSMSVTVKMPTPNVGLNSFNIDLSNENETASSNFLVDFDSDEQDKIITPEDIIDIETPTRRNSATQRVTDDSFSSIQSEVLSSTLAKSSDDDVAKPDAMQTQVRSNDRPFFKFDSAQPLDAGASKEELEEVTQAANLTGVSLSVTLSEPLHDDQACPPSTRTEERHDTEIEPTSLLADKSDRSINGLPAPTDTGKFLRWTGDDAVSMLHHMQDTQKALNIYRILSGQLKLVSEADIEKHLNAKTVPAVFLFSKHSSEEVMSQIRSRKWIDRIGHPQAVDMFLTLSPKRLVSEFFAMVSACLLLQNDEVELVREIPFRELLKDGDE